MVSRTIQGRKFILIGPVRPTLKEDGSIWTYAPQADYKKKATKKLHVHGHGVFCKFALEDTPKRLGVYLMVQRDKVQYVGETEDLTKRFNDGYGNISPANCYERGQRTNCHINKKILDVLRCGDQVEVWFHSCTDYKDLERQLISSLTPTPPWNLR